MYGSHRESPSDTPVDRPIGHATGTPSRLALEPGARLVVGGGTRTGDGRRPTLDVGAEPRGAVTMSAGASDMVTISRAELDALKAELRRLRREVGRNIAKARIQADPGSGDDVPAFTRGQLAEAWGIGE
jgi:hypothetical protein